MEKMYYQSLQRCIMAPVIDARDYDNDTLIFGYTCDRYFIRK
jgi:hypothetical protein